MNGLLGCVTRLVKAGAIISLVNNSQRTCCELADVGGHSDLASMLELALIFNLSTQTWLPSRDEYSRQFIAATDLHAR